MRTKVRLDDALLKAAKASAAAAGLTLTALIEEALRRRLGRATPYVSSDRENEERREHLKQDFVGELRNPFSSGTVPLLSYQRGGFARSQGAVGSWG